jgi:L-seryl-tRNA(Ser) seleniumtransferase
MLSMTTQQIRDRSQSFIARLKDQSSTIALRSEIIEGESAIGGGSGPMTHPSTALIALQHETLSAQALDEALRHARPPVIARITGDRVLLDLRTVRAEEEPSLLTALITL